MLVFLILMITFVFRIIFIAFRVCLIYQVYGLFLDVCNCKIMTFARIQSLVVFSYHLGDTYIVRFKVVLWILGFWSTVISILDLILNMFAKYIPKTLGFILRLCSEFRLYLSLKLLYCAFIRPVLKYQAVIWDPHNTWGYSMQLERVQRKFLRYPKFK